MQMSFSPADYWVIHRALVDSNHADLERARMYRDHPVGEHPAGELAEMFEQQAADTRRVTKDLEKLLGKLP